MSCLLPQSAVLIPHPATQSDAVRSIEVRLRAESPGTLFIQYSLAADMTRVRVPLSGTGGRADALWKHTCFEAFLAPVDASGYHEFNFSPSFAWAVYGFSAYREGMSAVEIGVAPEISVHRRPDGLELHAAVRWDLLADWRDARRVRIALAAVIEEESGRLSYWALRHSPGKPDFHDPHGFALEIDRS